MALEVLPLVGICPLCGSLTEDADSQCCAEHEVWVPVDGWQRALFEEAAA